MAIRHTNITQIENNLPIKKSKFYLHKLAFRRTAFQHIRDCDGDIAVAEVRVVPSAADGDTKAETGDTIQLDLVQLPGYSFTRLKA